MVETTKLTTGVLVAEYQLKKNGNGWANPVVENIEKDMTAAEAWVAEKPLIRGKAFDQGRYIISEISESQPIYESVELVDLDRFGSRTNVIYRNQKEYDDYLEREAEAKRAAEAAKRAAEANDPRPKGVCIHCKGEVRIYNSIMECPLCGEILFF